MTAPNVSNPSNNNHMRIPPENFLTDSLRTTPHGETITRVLAASIQAVDPENAVRKYLRQENNQLTLGDKVFNLDEIERIFVVAFGKASLPMALAAAEIIPDRLTAGIIITKAHSQFSIDHSTYKIIVASHPVPDQRGVEGAEQIIDLLKTSTENDLVICLISGGGSALLTAPVEGISLDNLQQLNRSLLACGAAIGEINTLRKHVSRLKGGSLARLAHPAQVASLILSDVIDDPLDVIASGPTVPDPTTFMDAMAVIERYRIARQIPKPVLDYLRDGCNGSHPETPKPADPIFEQVYTRIIGNNYQAAKAGLDQAQALGLQTILLTAALEGEARFLGPVLAAIARQIDQSGDPLPRPVCIIAGGESTVTIQGDGLGGRNQELALSAVEGLAGMENMYLIALASDGDDGPTDAAGAVVSGDTLTQAKDKNLNPSTYLNNNDAYHFFAPLGDLLKPGPTLTNVNDLTFIFAF
jgi:glycerate 2-kinase